MLCLKNVVHQGLRLCPILIFGYSFNKLFIPGKYMEYLSFGGCFNQPVVLCKNIVVLCIASSFDRVLNLTKKSKPLD